MFEDIFNKTKSMPFAQQKLEQMIVDGFSKNEIKKDVEILSVRPLPRYPHYKKILIKKEFGQISGIKVKYLGFLNLPIIKQFSVFFGNLFSIAKWSKKNKNEKRVVLMYGTNPLNSIPVFFVRLFCKIKAIAYVTEIDSLRNFNQDNLIGKIKKSIFINTSKCVENAYDGYILISKYMSEKINSKNKPSIVIEGMVNLNQNNYDDNQNEQQNADVKQKTVMYAGSLQKIYGIKTLVEAFIKAKIADCNLIIYGDGDYKKELIEISNSNKNIIYRGIALNSEIIKQENCSTLLVNPRPSGETLTRYSFPSKTFEYMISQTACLITKLDGIPAEYFNYCYTINFETVEEIAKQLKEILNLPNEILQKKAQEAKDFVLTNKSNIMQTKKIIEFANNI